MPLSDNPVAGAVSEDTGTPTDQQESAVENTEVSAAAEETSTTEEAPRSAPTSSPRLFAGRFKSAEEMENSYQELERAYTRRANDLHQLRKAAEQTPQNVEAETVRFAEDLKRNPVEAIRNLTKADLAEAKAEAKQARFETEYNHLKTTNKEFASLDPVMSRLAVEWEDMIVANNLQSDPRLLRVLYLAARGLKQTDLTKDAEEKGKQKGELIALKKTKAQIEGSSGTKGHIKKNFEELSLDEMEKEILRQEKAVS